MSAAAGMNEQEPAVVLCSNCQCRPVADVVLCGFSDWCAVCDASLHAHHQYELECDRQRNLRPPHDAVTAKENICTCGFIATRNWSLQRSGDVLNPDHMLVTVPITTSWTIIGCLVCERIFKHHRNALQHVCRHHQLELNHRQHNHSSAADAGAE